MLVPPWACNLKPLALKRGEKKRDTVYISVKRSRRLLSSLLLSACLTDWLSERIMRRRSNLSSKYLGQRNGPSHRRKCWERTDRWSMYIVGICASVAA